MCIRDSGAPKKDNAPKGTKKPRQPKEDYSKPLEYGVGPGKALIHYAPIRKDKDSTKKMRDSMKTEQTSVTGDGSKLSPKHLPGGPNSQYDIDGVPKTKKDNAPKEKKKDTAPKTRKTKYNPYGPGTANPSNMSTSTGP